MATQTLTFATGCSDVAPADLVLVEARGRQEMSSLYEYRLTLECHVDGGLAAEAIDGLLDTPCFVTQDGASPLEVHGVLAGVRLLAANEACPVLYEARLVPRLWNTTRVRRTRVFQEASVRDIVERVLGESSIALDVRLEESYPVREYTVQYEETDFAFVSRLLEHWGIFYFFVQGPDGETMVLGDGPHAFEEHPDFEVLTFSPSVGRTGVAGTVQSLTMEVVPQTAGVTVRDYNWRTPLVGLAASHEADTRTGYGVHWNYGDHFKDTDEGAMVARLRAEQELCLREAYTGVCSVPGLAPGQRVALFGCPIPDLNVTYLVTSVEPRLAVTSDSGDECYQYPFAAVALERDAPPVVPYRSQRRTAKPVVHGFMHGIVDGEVAGTAAPIDAEGRYRVILPMDSEAELGGRATRWIRMMQASSGNNYGIHFPLHMGTEVLVAHLDGDPDRPVILGSVPNPSTRSPIVLDEATRSRIRTRSGIELEFEDDA
jgi:type VI secretion system secreted protein VgrG